MTNEIYNWKQLVASTDNGIIDWAENQAWAVEMAGCMQDPAWHAEGDVWTHTKMVCKELMRLNDWSVLSRETQLKLLLTAIFHDVGKPATTYFDEPSGRIRSPKHARNGARIARRVLMDLGCDVKTREEICYLILFHGRPPYLGEKESPELELIKLSGFVDHRLLYLFALADTRGRVCTVQGHPEECLELWQLVAQENSCFDRPYVFSNDHARFLFYRGRLDNLHYRPHEDYRCTMTIMCGLPGAGKDSWLAKHRADLPVVSLDGLRKEQGVSPTDNQGEIVQAAKEQCRGYLRSESDFALNATNVTRQTRKLWIDLGADYDARIELVYVEPDFRTLVAQNGSRNSPVPSDVIHKLVGKMDPPTFTECHSLVNVFD